MLATKATSRRLQAMGQRRTRWGKFAKEDQWGIAKVAARPRWGVRTQRPRLITDDGRGYGD